MCVCVCAVNCVVLASVGRIESYFYWIQFLMVGATSKFPLMHHSIPVGHVGPVLEAGALVPANHTVHLFLDPI